MLRSRAERRSIHGGRGGQRTFSTAVQFLPFRPLCTPYELRRHVYVHLSFSTDTRSAVVAYSCLGERTKGNSRVID